jgi:ribose/xylose/arabinose/galactoside ABC-type transport system permease subunit
MTNVDVQKRSPLTVIADRARAFHLGTFWDRWGITAVFAILVIAAIIIQPGFDRGAFLNILNITSLLKEASYLGIVACAMTFAVINGTFDLSVGGQLALTSIVSLLAFGVGGSGLAIAAAIGTGIACGLVNSTLVTAMRVPPFVATLGMLFVFRGIGTLLTADGPAKLPYADFGSVFGQIGKITFAGIPLVFVIMVAFFGVGFVILRRTGLGRQVIAFGSSPAAARFSGISATRIRFFVFVFLGLSVGIAALTYVTRIGTADGAAQDGFELRVITAAVLGGASLQGGKGSLVGTFSAVMLVTVLNDLFRDLQVDSAWQRIILGCVLVVALAIDGLRTKFPGFSVFRRVLALRDQRMASAG